MTLRSSSELFEGFEEDGKKRVDITSGFFGCLHGLAKSSVRAPGPSTKISYRNSCRLHELKSGYTYG